MEKIIVLDKHIIREAQNQANLILFNSNIHTDSMKIVNQIAEVLKDVKIKIPNC